VPIPPNMMAQAEQVVARCRKLATFSEAEQGTTRTFLSEPMHDCHAALSAWLEAAGAEVRIDAVGNIRALYGAESTPGPRLLIGSHLDTVPNAGAYDGVLGVVLAVGLLEALEHKRLPFAIEVVGFSEEEGVRFGIPFIGSRALVGRVDESVLNCHDSNGISVRAAVEAFGLNPAEIPEAIVADDTLAYIEFHIEQGPVLESLERPLGAVEAIVGQTRMEFTFVGQSNHAGTTPMQFRHDAIVGASEWILAVERAGRSEPDLVATVGQVQVKPGAANVIAGEARVTLDVRHGLDHIRTGVVSELMAQAEEGANRRGLFVQHSLLLNQKAVAMDSFLVEQIDEAIRKTGSKPYRMTSGAGHDAMIMAEKIPSAMVFLRSPGGISHDAVESVETQDVAKALECGLHLLDQLACCSEFMKRTSRA
jgi:allantoate deiminase